MSGVHDLDHLAVGERLVEGLGRGQDSGEPPDPRGMPGFHGVDAERCGEIVLGLEPRRLLLIGGCREILEGDRGAAKRLRVLGDTVEVDLGSLIAADFSCALNART
jgi:hypothetical protein